MTCHPAFNLFIFIHSQIFMSFDVRTNWKKLIIASVDDRLACLNGVRALSMFWIIYGHTFFNALAGGFANSMCVRACVRVCVRACVRVLLPLMLLVPQDFPSSVVHLTVIDARHRRWFGCLVGWSPGCFSD
jgi:hypothetical protein